MNSSYKNALGLALGLHVFLLTVLCMDSSSSEHPVLEAAKEPSQSLELAAAQPQEIVKAVSVDAKDLDDTVSRIKQERLAKAQAEAQRQRQAERKLQEAAKQLARMKEEANRVAIARKKEAEAEKLRLKALAAQKVEEAKKLEALKKEQELLKQKQIAEQKNLEKQKKMAEDAKAKAKADAEKEIALNKARLAEEDRKAKAAAAAQANAQATAARNAQMAGVVDKYKALILNAIGQQWILPDNVNPQLSSQFRIRLAPDGSVMDVALIKSSGDALLDRSAQNAIYKASPLPVPTEPGMFNIFRDISLTVRPEQVRG